MQHAFQHCIKYTLYFGTNISGMWQDMLSIKGSAKYCYIVNILKAIILKVFVIWLYTQWNHEFVYGVKIFVYILFIIVTTNLCVSDALPTTTSKGNKNKSMACVESNLLTKRHIFIPAYRSSLCYYSFEVYIKMNFYLYDNFIARRQTSTIYL